MTNLKITYITSVSFTPENISRLKWVNDNTKLMLMVKPSSNPAVITERLFEEITPYFETSLPKEVSREQVSNAICKTVFDNMGQIFVDLSNNQNQPIVFVAVNW